MFDNLFLNFDLLLDSIYFCRDFRETLSRVACLGGSTDEESRVALRVGGGCLPGSARQLGLKRTGLLKTRCCHEHSGERIRLVLHCVDGECLRVDADVWIDSMCTRIKHVLQYT